MLNIGDTKCPMYTRSLKLQGMPSTALKGGHAYESTAPTGSQYKNNITDVFTC